MADNSGTRLNLLKIPIKEEYNPTYVKLEDDDQEIIKTETEISGGSWVYPNVDINELPANENRNLENSEDQLLNGNTGIKEQAFEGDLKIWERINNLSANRNKVNESEMHIVNENVDFDGEEKVPQQNRNESVKISIIEEKRSRLHVDNDCLSTDTLKKNVLVSQQKSEKVVVLNRTKGKKQKSVRNDSNVTKKKYNCNECSYAAVRRQELLVHVKSHHTMEKPYKCSECSYAGVQKRDLLSHIKFRHSMEKPHKCNECSYAAVHKRDLLSHIQSRHTMEKPHKCNECSYAAVQKRHLLSHIQSRHTMKKPYKCNECSYAAVRKHALLFHTQYCHTMEKPYKCHECSYAAVQKHDLLSHIQSRHTMEKPYKCNECSYAVVQKHRLVYHIQRCHNQQC